MMIAKQQVHEKNKDLLTLMFLVVRPEEIKFNTFYMRLDAEVHFSPLVTYSVA